MDYVQTTVSLKTILTGLELLRITYVNMVKHNPFQAIILNCKEYSDKIDAFLKLIKLGKDIPRPIYVHDLIFKRLNVGNASLLINLFKLCKLSPYRLNAAC